MFIEEIQKIYTSGKLTKKEDIQKYIPTEIQKYINYSIIADRVSFRPKNKYRHFETLNISVFLKNETDITQIIEKLLNTIEDSVLLYIDFDGIFQTKDNFKFEFASKNTRVNEHFKIVSEKSAKNLLNEFKSKTYAEIVNTHFERHKKVLDYVSSGFRPYMLLSMKIYIQTL